VQQCFGRIIPGPPWHGFLGAEGSFVDIPVWRSPRISGKDDFLYPEGIRGAEHRSNILKAAKISKDGHHGDFGVIFGLIHGRAVQFIHAFGAHARRDFLGLSPQIKSGPCVFKDALLIPELWRFPAFW
jgi:hypothetical protein